MEVFHMSWDVPSGKGSEPHVQGGLLVDELHTEVWVREPGNTGMSHNWGIRLGTPTTGSSSDLLLDPTSERGVNVGSRAGIFHPFFA